MSEHLMKTEVVGNYDWGEPTASYRWTSLVLRNKRLKFKILEISLIILMEFREYASN
jgi:hypothetical protein